MNGWKIFLKDWWADVTYWKKGVCIGVLVGLLKLPFLLEFGSLLPEFLGNAWTFIPDQILCNLLSLSMGEPCGFFMLYWGWVYNPIFYGMLGGLIGYIYGKYKR